MITYKCKTCGGQMEFSGPGGFTCPYCGSKSFFSDADFKDNEKFRKMLLQYYRAEAEKKDSDYAADTLWTCTGREEYLLESGQPLRIEYMRKYEFGGGVCFLAKESVVYVFDRAKDADAMLTGLNRLTLPEADAKLYRAFPEFRMSLALSGGRQALVFRRRPNLYPAQLFAPWASVHLAWVISRMENICCALRYSGIEHGDISPLTVWVDPTLHEGVLFGDWRKVRTLSGRADLQALRKTAVALAQNTRDPIELYEFLNSAPESDAYEDFAKWDRVINEGFGGHKFVKMHP